MIDRTTLRLELKAESPVFCGSGEKIPSSGYINEPGKTVSFIDEGLFAAFLNGKGLLDRYAQMLAGGKKADLKEYLTELRVSPGQYREFVRYTLDVSHLGEDRINDIVLFTKTVGHRPYIPGSSLKGALRTALAAGLMKRDDKLRAAVWKDAEDFFQRQQWRRPVDSIEQKLFARNMDLFDSKRVTAVDDCLRGLLVSDSGLLSLQDLCLVQKIDVSTHPGRNDYFGELPLFRECLEPSTKAVFDVTLDFNLLGNLGIRSAKDFWSVLDTGLETLYELNRSTHKLPLDGIDIRDPQKGRILTLGGGAGYQSKTVTYPAADSRPKAVNHVRNMMENQFRQHKHLALDKEISPRTVKLTDFDGTYYRMGVCSLREVSACPH